MKEGLQRNVKQISSARGTFSGYVVQGFQYESASGELGWNITSWPINDPVHTFWVEDGAFHKTSIHIDWNGHVTVHINDMIRNVDPKERAAVLEAISAWENPPSASESDIASSA